MFNAPRPAQRYNGNTNNGFGGSFVDENPLSSSAYDSVDPWSAAPTPSISPAPVATANSVFSSVIADATVPSIYDRAFAAVDPTSTGETSVNALSRVLGTSSLPAATIDRIVNLVSSRPRVSKLEFFVALALVALAQSGKDISIEQVAALASQNSLPIPTLDIDSLPPSGSVFTTGPSDFKPAVRHPAPAYSTDDPWSTTRYNVPPIVGTSVPSVLGGRPTMSQGATSTFSGTGLPPDWWKKQEKVSVTLLGQQGFILNRYTVYEVATERGAVVPRRYSEFVFLWEVFTRRYPFRLFPALPPKRIGPDEHFLEQRRRGLERSLTFVVNHPIIKDDPVLSVFLTEPSFETWRKSTSVSLDEESASKRIDRTEEMGIPSDLEDKLAVVRGKISPLIEQWQRICILAERIIKKREAAAVRATTSRRTYLPAHFSSLLSFNNDSSDSPFNPAAALLSSASSVLSASTTLPFPGAATAPPSDDLIDRLLGTGPQGDMARLTNTLKAVVEVNERPWRGEDDELSLGVRHGIEQIAAHAQRHSDLADLRTRVLFNSTLEALKSQRDLYIAMRDLFIRQDRYANDQVDRLKKRVESNQMKMEGLRAAQKENWQEEVDRLTVLIEKDQATITAQLHRRVFIRACMWHELRVVLHNRENTLLTVAVRAFAREEHEYAENIANNWMSLSDAVENMPYE